MHSCRLKLVLPCDLLVSMQSCFLGTTRIGLAQSLILHEMMPASSSCLILSSMNLWYFSRTVYGLDMISGPSVGMSNLIKLVLPISIVFCEIICRYFLSSSSWSFVLASSEMSTSSIELAKLLISGSSCKLVFCGICGSSWRCHTGDCSSWPPELPHTFPQDA